MRKGSSADTEFQNQLKNFIDRELIKKMFKQYLRSSQGGDFILAIKGNIGTGQTFLIHYLTKHVCPKLKSSWHTGRLSFPSPMTPIFHDILNVLESVLEGCVPSDTFQQYLTECKEYNRRFEENKKAVIVNIEVKADHQSKIIDAQTRVHVDTQLRELQLHLRTSLSNALIELSGARQQPLCLFIDNYERLAEVTPELAAWLFHNILSRMSQMTDLPLRIVTCGWVIPSPATVEPFHVQEAKLEDFDQEQVRYYLKKHKVIAPDQSVMDSEELVAAFYDLTKGHPFVLRLAVTYFKALDNHERTAQSLQTNRLLIDEQMRVKFLGELLLSRLSEPYRMLLERGPILRSFDQAALRALLDIDNDGASGKGLLDDRTYEHLLQYPFIVWEYTSGEALTPQPTFHKLIHRVQLEALRHHHPATKEQLHRTMTDYYKMIIEATVDWEVIHAASAKDASRTETIERLDKLSEEKFKALLEYFYHALQVKNLRNETFRVWQALTTRAINGWRNRHARSLLEVVGQLVEEDEPFLNQTSLRHVLYLLLYSRFLMNESTLETARVVLEDADRICERSGYLDARATALNNLGTIYYDQGKLEEALEDHKQALFLRQNLGNSVDIAYSYNNIGTVYSAQGKWEEALRHFEAALTIYKRVGHIHGTSTVLDNLGNLYHNQGKLDEALEYHKQALIYDEQAGNLAGIANSLNNIGTVYLQQNQWEEALRYLEQALTLWKQTGNLAGIANSLNNIGTVYLQQNQWEEALRYLEHALRLREEVDLPPAIANTLNNIGVLYQNQGKWEQAIGYFDRAINLFERLGRGFEIKAIHTLAGLTFCYAALEDPEKLLSFILQIPEKYKLLEVTLQQGVPREPTRPSSTIRSVRTRIPSSRRRRWRKRKET